MQKRLLLLACFAAACSAPAATTVTAEPASPATTLGQIAVEQPPPPPSEPEPPKEPERPRFPHSADQVAKLKAQLAAALDAPESRSLTSGVRVVDAATGEVLFRKDDERALVPASNTKLFTTFAALRALGPTARSKVTVSLSGRRTKDRVEALVIDGAAVPFGAPFATLDASMAAVVAGLRQRNVKRVERLVITSPAVSTPDRFQELDLAVHRDRTASAVRKSLGRANIAVGKLGDAPVGAGAEVLVEIDGPSVAEWIAPVNQLSHNGLADALSIHLGHAVGTAASLAGGAAVVARELDRAGITGVELSDGSGLSRKNHVNARAITDLLVAARTDDTFVSSLAVGGVVGTLAGRMKDPALAGRVHAKTGTLKEVIATSGYLDHAVDGRRYVFAIVTNGVEEGGGPNARAMHDRWLTILASEWWT